MLANDGELDGKRHLSHAAMEELRKEQTGTTKTNVHNAFMVQLVLAVLGQR